MQKWSPTQSTDTDHCRYPTLRILLRILPGSKLLCSSYHTIPSTHVAKFLLCQRDLRTLTVMASTARNHAAASLAQDSIAIMEPAVPAWLKTASTTCGPVDTLPRNSHMSTCTWYRPAEAVRCSRRNTACTPGTQHTSIALADNSPPVCHTLLAFPR